MKRYPTDAYVGDYEKTNVQKLRANQKMCKNKKKRTLRRETDRD